MHADSSSARAPMRWLRVSRHDGAPLFPRIQFPTQQFMPNATLGFAGAGTQCTYAVYPFAADVRTVDTHLIPLLLFLVRAGKADIQKVACHVGSANLRLTPHGGDTNCPRFPVPLFPDCIP